jgi:predicted lipid-binding transport protein (Tim44 family)
MNKKTRFSILILFSLTLGLLYLLHETAEASRMGRGGSFGGKRSYQRSAPEPAKNPAPSQAKQGQTAQQQPVASPSPMSRWGGMLGGLVMGSLIGSMLFGGGEGTGGPGMMDLLLIGGGCFLLYRFLRARRMAAQAAGPGGAMPFESNPSQGWGSSDDSSYEDAAPAQQPALPPGFNADEFLKGANAVYVRLQASWAKRDLLDIRQFTSNEVFEEISRQAQEDPVPGKTELLMINSRVIEVRDVDNQTIVSVLYDVIMRENEDTLSKQVRELWHFSQEQDKPEAVWLLEGIQQVES